MSPTTDTETALPTLAESWPRVADWLESRIPADLSWRTGLIHGVRIEEFSDDGSFVIRAELPGMDPEKDIEIRVANELLTIEGRRQSEHHQGHRSEFFYGKFSRTLSLPNGCDVDHINATYDNGILEVAMPINHETSQTRRIEITHH